MKPIGRILHLLSSSLLFGARRYSFLPEHYNSQPTGPEARQTMPIVANSLGTVVVLTSYKQEIMRFPLLADESIQERRSCSRLGLLSLSKFTPVIKFLGDRSQKLKNTDFPGSFFNRMLFLQSNSEWLVIL